MPDCSANKKDSRRARLKGRTHRIHISAWTIAKNIIDILLVVADSSDETSYVPDLEKAGYRLTIREPAWNQHRLLKGADTNINLHVFTIGSAEIERHLLLRDWLRANPKERELYAETKNKLASQKWHHVQTMPTPSQT